MRSTLQNVFHTQWFETKNIKRLAVNFKSQTFAFLTKNVIITYMYAINDLDKINISKLLVHMDLQAQVLEDINIGI